MAVASVQEIIAELRRRRMVIIVDNEERENEGDLLVAAERVDAGLINFMARYGRGLICLTLTQERCSQLNLPLMVGATNTSFSTNFTVSIDASRGISTGISAQDRAHTIRTAVKSDACPADIVQPGHIFPLMAQPGGVLTRAGHTEAGCDLARLAGFEAAAAIVEILNEDGSMARLEQLKTFAQEHQLKIGLIEDLIAYRLENEATVHRRDSMAVKNRFGQFTMHLYEDLVHNTTHVALTRGQIKRQRTTLVRVHSEQTLSDTLGLYQSGRDAYRLSGIMRRFSKIEPCAILVLRLPKRYQSLADDARRLAAGDESEQSACYDRWTIGVGGQMLRDLGVGKMQVLGTPHDYRGLGGFGLSVQSYVEQDNE